VAGLPAGERRACAACTRWCSVIEHAVARRRYLCNPGITIFAKDGADGGLASSGAFEISGEHSKLAFSDGVAFVPPRDRYLARLLPEGPLVNTY
jgi:hypothetical protein